MRRFLLDNDGSNVFHHLGEDVEGCVEETVRECAGNVTTYLMCSGAGTCYFPTRAGDVNPRLAGLLAAHRRGLDPLGMILRGLKAAGKETFITYRMNDVHNPTDADQWNVPRVRREDPECIVGLDEVRAGRAGWMSYCLDYARAEVRRYVLDLIREQAQLYGDVIDGFQLDWMRFPRHLSGTVEEVWEKRDVLTEFTAEARAVLRGAGRPILLGARVPTTPAGCRRMGLDVAEWARRGLIDLLVACPFLTTDWRIPVEEFRALLGGAAIPVYAGFDLGFGWQTHFPESLRGVCTSLYDCGADGIYVFNFPCWTERLAARPYHWLAGLEDPRTAAAKPLLLAVDHKRSRVEGVDAPWQVPAKVPAGESKSFTVHVPRAALPAWRCLVLVRSGGDIELAVNGQPARERRWGPGDAPFRSEIFLEFARWRGDTSSQPKPEDCRVFAVDAAALHAGPNSVVVANREARELEVERINVGLW